MDLEQCSAVEQIKQLKARYFRFMDLKKWDDWRGLFANEDFYAEADGSSFTDADEFVGLVSTLLAPVKSAHHGHTPEITLAGGTVPTEASGIWAMADLLVFPGDPASGIRGYGHYTDGYRLNDDGEWVIASTVLTRLFMEPLAGGYPEGGPWPLRESN